jgi:FKBP-type peptidyl-prolyl cis-trans isomerase
MNFPGINFLRLILFFITCLEACHHESSQVMVPDDSIREHMVQANKIIVQNESKEIEEFISRHSWKMISTGTGLRYEIYRQGYGKKAAAEKQVSVLFHAYLLDGSLCDSSGEKPLQITLGHGEQVRGLEEGIVLMKEGDQARLIVPAHLGFGVRGNGNNIPGNSPLYYDVTLLKVNESK